MQTAYQLLLENMNQGRRCALVTKYNASGITKTIVPDTAAVFATMPFDPGSIGMVETDDEVVLAELYSPKPRMIILGGGHIALPLVATGATLGFDVVVFDDRPSFANAARFPAATEVICDSFDNMADRLNIRRNDYVVIVTRGHRYDSMCLRGIIAGEFPYYVGMIGSRRRVAIVKSQVAEETGAADKVAQLHSPIGLAIGAVTPEEIAISILAEIIQVKRQGKAADRSGGTKALGDAVPDMELLEWLAQDHAEPFALVTIVSTIGSTPREAGAKMAVNPLGQIVGSIGGGCAEAEVIQHAIDTIGTGSYRFDEVDMSDSAEEDGMVCGGTMRVLIEAV